MNDKPQGPQGWWQRRKLRKVVGAWASMFAGSNWRLGARSGICDHCGTYSRTLWPDDPKHPRRWFAAYCVILEGRR